MESVQLRLGLVPLTTFGATKELVFVPSNKVIHQVSRLLETNFSTKLTRKAPHVNLLFVLSQHLPGPELLLTIVALVLNFFGKDLDHVASVSQMNHLLVVFQEDLGEESLFAVIAPPVASAASL